MWEQPFLFARNGRAVGRWHKGGDFCGAYCFGVEVVEGGCAESETFAQLSAS